MYICVYIAKGFFGYNPFICWILQSYLVHPEGFEPPTKWFEATYSIQLSYGCVITRGTAAVLRLVA